MKKKILLVGVIAVIGLSMFLVSCSKDEFHGCTCTKVEYDGWRGTFTVSAAEAEQYGATNCKMVAGLSMAADSDAMSVNCTPL